MKSETSGYDIFVTFDEADWLRTLENGKSAVREAIDVIKVKFPFPVSQYVPETKTWIIACHSPHHRDECRAEISAIKKEFFQDANQLELL